MKTKTNSARTNRISGYKWWVNSNEKQINEIWNFPLNEQKNVLTENSFAATFNMGLLQQLNKTETEKKRVKKEGRERERENMSKSCTQLVNELRKYCVFIEKVFHISNNYSWCCCYLKCGCFVIFFGIQIARMLHISATKTKPLFASLRLNHLLHYAPCYCRTERKKAQNIHLRNERHQLTLNMHNTGKTNRIKCTRNIFTTHIL